MKPVVPLKLGGAYGSPYTLKMRAVLRYRRIPFTWVLRGLEVGRPAAGARAADPGHRVPGRARVYSEAMIDSSPLIERLEGMFAERSLVPTDPVVAFLDYLVEDYADEWVTKAMYHYRWYYDDAIEKAGSAAAARPGSADVRRRLGEGQAVHHRTPDLPAGVGRLDRGEPARHRALVRTAARPVAAQSAASGRSCSATARAAATSASSASCASSSAGTRSRLASPSPRAAGRQLGRHGRRPVVVAGRRRRGWGDRDDIPDDDVALLSEIGRTYAPFMLANAEALQAGAEEMVCTIDGTEYRQGPFPYQGKCLAWLRERQRRALRPIGPRSMLCWPVPAARLCSQMTNSVALYGHWICPYVLRVEFALAQRGVAYDLVDLPPSAVRPVGFVLPPEFVEHSPRLEVPMLRIGERYLADSIPILEWMETEFPGQPVASRFGSGTNAGARNGCSGSTSSCSGR